MNEGKSGLCVNACVSVCQREIPDTQHIDLSQSPLQGSLISAERKLLVLAATQFPPLTSDRLPTDGHNAETLPLLASTDSLLPPLKAHYIVLVFCTKHNVLCHSLYYSDLRYTTCLSLIWVNLCILKGWCDSTSAMLLSLTAQRPCSCI